MDTRTGKIHELKDDEAANELMARLGGKLVKLTDLEAKLMRQLPEEGRPEELALMKFMADREKLGGPRGYDVQNAFRLGYKAAVKDRS